MSIERRGDRMTRSEIGIVREYGLHGQTRIWEGEQRKYVRTGPHSFLGIDNQTERVTHYQVRSGQEIVQLKPVEIKSTLLESQERSEDFFI
jgi:hypothetical protein